MKRKRGERQGPCSQISCSCELTAHRSYSLSEESFLYIGNDGRVSDIAKPETSFRPHGGPYEGKPAEELVQDAGGRAWLAQHVASQSAPRQRIGLAWLSWGLQREVRLEDLDEIADAAEG